MLAFLVALVTGCVAMQPARQPALAYNELVVALVLLDDNTSKYLAQLDQPSAEELDAASLGVHRLFRAHTLLGAARSALSHGAPLAATQALQAASVELRSVADWLAYAFEADYYVVELLNRADRLLAARYTYAFA